MSLADKIEQAVAQRINPQAGRQWSARELYTTAFPRIEGALCDKVFVPRSVGILIGDFGIGKTWLTLSLASSIALGIPWGHMPTRARKVLYVSEEMTEEELHERSLQLFSVADVDDLEGRMFFRFQTGLKLENPDDCQRLVKYIAECGAEIVILDATRDIHGCDENSNNEMSTVFRNIRDKVAKVSGACVILIHHTSKPSEFRKGAHRGRGAVVINDVCANILVIEKGEHGCHSVTFEKVRHRKPPAPFAYEIVGGAEDGSRVQFEIQQSSFSSEDALQARQLGDEIQKDGSMTLELIMRRFSWSKRTAGRVIARALESGRIENSSPRGTAAVYRPRTLA